MFGDPDTCTEMGVPKCLAAGITKDVFEQAMGTLSEICKRALQNGARALICGGDFQLELQPDIADWAECDGEAIV